MPFLSAFYSLEEAKGAYGVFLVVASDSDPDLIEKAGFVCDGVADDVQIQQAIDKAKVVSDGTIYFAAGTYTLAASLKMNDGITLHFDHCILKAGASAPTDRLIFYSGSVNCSITGWVDFDGNSVCDDAISGTTSGEDTDNLQIVPERMTITGCLVAGIDIFKGHGLVFRNIEGADQPQLIRTNRAVDILLDNIRSIGTGIDIWLGQRVIQINSSNVAEPLKNVTLNNIFIEGAFNATNEDTTALDIRSDSGTITNLQLNNIHVKDWHHDGINLLKIQSAVVNNVMVDHCNSGGFFCNGENFTVNNVLVQNCLGTGFIFGDAIASGTFQNMVLNNVVARNNGASTGVDKDTAGIRFRGHTDSHIKNVVLNNCRCYDDGGGDEAQRIGILFEDFLDDFTINNCDVNGNTVDGFRINNPANMTGLMIGNQMNGQVLKAVALVGGVLTINSNLCEVTSQTGATDALDTITNIFAIGQQITLSATAGDTITVTNASGNIQCGSDFVMVGDNFDRIILEWDGTNFV